ncbi:hypothetical protein GN244_ATG14069 [Phytophthora infestans]|uniref:Uncharacterized protein n=1 Tax=Phytophthora infestans TaxID=4787 RepID=A0A833W8P5_PHYIN|nr:hypothetical protein GN244_ATG14069 [Phytophthora infestans]
MGHLEDTENENAKEDLIRAAAALAGEEPPVAVQRSDSAVAEEASDDFMSRNLGEGRRAATAGGWFPLTPQAPTHFAHETGEVMV